MVPLSDPIASSFAKQIEELEGFLTSRWAWPSPDAGFACYVFAATGETGPVPNASGLEWPIPQAMRNAQTLAAAGYLIACGVPVSREQRSEWVEALAHLCDREPFPLDRQSFTFRPLEVMGIVLGAEKCPELEASVRDRLLAIVKRLPVEGNEDAWSAYVYAISGYLIGAAYAPSMPSNEMSMAALAFAKWIAVAFEDRLPVSTIQNRDMLDRLLLEKCALGDLDISDIGPVAVEHFALTRTVSERIRSRLAETWPVNRESQDAVVIIEQLCRRFPLFARQVRQRRCDVTVPGATDKKERPTIEMQDEYDVQDALHAILKLHFDDVRKEEWAPSYAGGQSRMDFVLKREKIVVETKMMRATLKQSDVAKQLAVDEKFYRTYPDCKTLVCFVYDPDCRCHNPAALEHDASSSDNEFRVVVIVSPKGT